MSRVAPGISVVIPTLNEAEDLPGAIESVERALGASAEVIVADGGSRDGTLDRVDGRAHIVRSPRGRGIQLNAGARSARADILVFLHADTRLPSDAGDAIPRALGSGRAVGGCFRLRLYGPTAGRPVARGLAAAIGLRSRLLRTATGDQAIFCRRSAFDRVGGFPEIELFEDVLFYRSLRRLGRVVVVGATVTTSDRRWREHGYPRTILTHLGLRTLFSLGVPPDRLARLYRRPTTTGIRSRSSATR